MGRTLLDLADSLDKKIEEIEQAASDHAVKVTLTILGDLLYKTPVDTSKALSNWDVSLSARTMTPHDAYVIGEKGSSQRASAAEAMSAAKRTLAQKKPGQVIFITNNVPYIGRLNDGYSKQAPAGFVERAVLIGRKLKSKFTLRK